MKTPTTYNAVGTTQYVVNPNTGRPVSVLGRVYKELVNSGRLRARSIQHANILRDSDDYEDIKYCNKRLPAHQQAVKGRGNMKGKTVIRNMPRNWRSEIEEEEEEEEEGDESSDY